MNGHELALTTLERGGTEVAMKMLVRTENSERLEMPADRTSRSLTLLPDEHELTVTRLSSNFTADPLLTAPSTDNSGEHAHELFFDSMVLSWIHTVDPALSLYSTSKSMEEPVEIRLP